MPTFVRNLAAVARTRGRPPFILCYHGVGEPASPDPSALFVSRRRFAEQLDLIAGLGYEMLTVSELWRRISGEGTPQGIGAVTFDDALAGVAEHALPELDARGFPCTLYVATGLVGRPHPHLPAERVMTAAELEGLAAERVEVGGHTVDHVNLRGLNRARLLDELRRSRDELAATVGREVRSMAYPFGAHDAAVRAAAQEAGYETACGCSGPAPWRPFALPREPVFPSTSAGQMRVKIAGLYGPVHLARRIRAGSGPVAA